MCTDRPLCRRARAIRLAALLACVASLGACRDVRPQLAVAGGEPDRGKQAIERYGCGSCHIIPGVSGANGLVGPPLIRWSQRTYIAGEVPNNTENLIRWIEVPQAIEPKTDMPNLGVSQGDARDIAAYLYTIR